VADRSQRSPFDAVDHDARRSDAADVGTHLDEHVAHVDDLGLARGVVDGRRPVGEHGGGDDVLRGSDAREREGDVGAVQALRRRVQLAVGELERRAHRLQPGDVHVDRARTEVVAARHRQAHFAAPGQQRAEHVDRGADPLDQLVGSDGDELSVVGQHEPAALGAPRSDAEGGEELAHDRHVVDRRDVGQLVVAVGEQAHSHQLEHGVLRPGDTDRALQRADVTDRDLVRCYRLAHRPASMLRP
jgi:hypothetical protein